MTKRGDRKHGDSVVASGAAVREAGIRERILDVRRNEIAAFVLVRIQEGIVSGAAATGTAKDGVVSVRGGIGMKGGWSRSENGRVSVMERSGGRH